MAASPNSGVNTVTGEGLDEVLAGAQVVVDVSNAPDWDDDAVMEFFQRSSLISWRRRRPRAWRITWRCRSWAQSG